ncbi:large ribosomal subunit protein mL42 isoform X1 [Pseudorca crassidens]|uniref:large ribosomal subunit protein mL42 isoform X1 n=1 Tax=Pseudorca crassidens TaxID=82174 RepID=UPI00352DC668
MALAAVKWAISSRTILKHLFPIQNGALYCVCHKTTYSSLPDDYNCKVELALTSDGRTIVCYHPSVDIPYEHTKPIPRPDPVQNNEETHDLVLKTRLEEKGEELEIFLPHQTASIPERHPDRTSAMDCLTSSGREVGKNKNTRGTEQPSLSPAPDGNGLEVFPQGRVLELFLEILCPLLHRGELTYLCTTFWGVGCRMGIEG